MIPAIRRAASRRRNSGVVTFDNAANDAAGAGTVTINMVTGAGACAIVFAAGNLTNGATVDGVAMTLLGKTSNAAMYIAFGLTAGSHTFVITRGTGGTSFITTVVSYVGAVSAMGFSTGSGSSNSPILNYDGPGGLAVAGFDISAGSSEIATITSTGDVRVRIRRTTANAMILADSITVPISLSTPSSNSWTSIGVRLIPGSA